MNKTQYALTCEIHRRLTAEEDAGFELAVLADRLEEEDKAETAKAVRAFATNPLMGRFCRGRLIVTLTGDWSYPELATVPLACAPPAPVEGERVLSAVQVAVAQALALAHGHTWGNATLPPNVDLTASQIEAVVLATDDPGPCGWGIVAPSVDDEGLVRHSTGTGRLDWAVCSDGSVDAHVCRPAGPCIRVCAWVDEDAGHVLVTTTRTNKRRVPIETRHIEAAKELAQLAGSAVSAATGLPVRFSLADLMPTREEEEADHYDRLQESLS